MVQDYDDGSIDTLFLLNEFRSESSYFRFLDIETFKVARNKTNLVALTALVLSLHLQE